MKGKILHRTADHLQMCRRKKCWKAAVSCLMVMVMLWAACPQMLTAATLAEEEGSVSTESENVEHLPEVEESAADISKENGSERDPIDEVIVSGDDEILVTEPQADPTDGTVELNQAFHYENEDISVAVTVEGTASVVSETEGECSVGSNTTISIQTIPR